EGEDPTDDHGRDQEDDETVREAEGWLHQEVAPSGGEPVERHGGAVVPLPGAFPEERRHHRRDRGGDVLHCSTSPRSPGRCGEQDDWAALNEPRRAPGSPGRKCATHGGCEVTATATRCVFAPMTRTSPAPTANQIAALFLRPRFASGALIGRAPFDRRYRGRESSDPR